MGIFKTRKNKRYDYKPRYYQGDGEGSPYEIKRKFDAYRKTTGNPGGIKTRFNSAMDDLKSNPNREVNRRVMIIILVLILIFLFLIDFDLSIFFR